MNDFTEIGRNILSTQPFSQFLGTELDELGPGSVVLSLTIQDAFKQQHGFVHGGVLSYLADNALTFAGGTLLMNCVTSEYKINYLRPATGNKLVAKAKVLSSGKRQAVCQCEIYAHQEGEEARLVAIAQGTITKIEPKG
ncbi:phenylacetic acid degradation protein [Elysia marginata]|uniref:Phenylacetic acid degradation protein n=1 Tax=Elysia marginata TaxID=1093978 RepID=A0AAV4FD42_9GAST|nr:phenylacetic acid degradation protein [Elysia marginata]